MSGILILGEHRRGALRPGVVEAISAAEQIKAETGGSVSVLLLAPDPAQYISAVSLGCVDEVLLASSAVADEFEPHLFQAALRQVIRERAPSVVLIPHSVDGCGLAPALASELDAGFASDVFALHYDAGDLVATRAAYKEKVFVELDFPGKSTIVLTLRSGAFPAATAPAPASVTALTLDLPERAVRSRHLGWKDPPPNGGIDIPGAPFILSIGRGVADEANVERFLELADRLGATLGCSRPIADNGWLPKARQVGQSGQLAAKCKLYIAMGISGSVQHQWGMKHVETIIAVNKDPDASIFSIAKYGVVGDMLEIAEELQKQSLAAG
jgi:electron transfer flavoprotein alpha subunit